MTTQPDQGHPRRWAALGALCLSLVVVTLDNTVLNTALPALARALRATTSDLQWITDAYTLVFAALLVTAGGLGARLGLRGAIVGGMVVFAAGSAAAAMSTSSAELIGFRAVMGLGAAFVMPATLAMITQLFPPHERAKAIGVWSATAGVGVLLGPVLGGALLVHFSWGSVFWINVPLIALSLIGVLALVPALPGRATGRLDLLGALLSAAGLTALVDLIVEAPQRGWLSGTSLAEAGAAGALLALFVAWQLRARYPMIDVRVFARRGFAVAAGSLGVTFFALFGALFLFSQYLQLVHGYSALRAGLGAMPFAVAMAATAATSSLVAARLGTRVTVALGLAVMGGALVTLSLATVDTRFPVLAAILGTMGAGMGLVMAPSSEFTMGAVPRERAAMASSINSVVRELGGVLGIAVVGSVASAAYRHDLTAPAPGAARDLTSAHVIAAHLPAGPRAELIGAANHAFTSATDTGMRVAAAVAFAG
ncbi:MAG TPA: DHA2 family efflux MFS transporter permease subunit, partial [Rugosimonospora sp.]|nr:DHA2 family efflux MFS transporter permease subunit [Rugosimonospora sp.]